MPEQPSPPRTSARQSRTGAARLIAAAVAAHVILLLQAVFSSLGNPNAFVLFWVALAAALVAGGVGLLKGLRWGWYAAMAAISVRALLDLASVSLLGLLFDALVIFLLTRPGVRAKFGVR